jgi:DnaJ-class molecular chaperone
MTLTANEYAEIERDRASGRNTAEDDVCPVCHGFGDNEDGTSCKPCAGFGTRDAYDARNKPEAA